MSHQPRQSKSSNRDDNSNVFSPKSVEVGSYLFLSLHPSSAHFLATLVGKPRSTSRRHGSQDLGKERQMRSNVTERSSFCAHPKSRPHACEARNHGHLYRTLWVLSGSAVRGPIHWQGGDSTDREISARSTKRFTKPMRETFVGAHSVLSRRGRGARNHADLYRTLWVLSGSALGGPMRIQGRDSTGRQISATSRKCPTQRGPEIFVSAHSVLRISLLQDRFRNQRSSNSFPFLEQQFPTWSVRSKLRSCTHS